MTGYLINFCVYTFAMIGVIFIALMVFKKTALNQHNNPKNTQLKVEEAMSLSPRKTLYIVKAGAEKFLIAADIENTTMLSRLESTEKTMTEPKQKVEKAVLSENIKKITNFSDFKKESQWEKQPVMKELIRKLQRG